MHWYDWAGFAVLGTLAAALIVLFPVSIGRNLKAGHTYRKKLAQKIEALPMGRMLERLGIDEYRLLHEKDGVHLHEEIQRCASCDAKQTCEEVVETHQHLAPDDIDFCPNRDELADVLKAQAIDKG